MGSIYNKLNVLKFEDQKIQREQVYENILGLLQTGQFQPGEQIPGSQKLAALLGIHPATVHIALTRLAREGWLNRIPNKGTYVADRKPRLTCVGGYSRLSIKEAPFAHAVREALKEELHKDGIEMDLWMDTRPSDQYGEPLKPLIKAAEQRRFQAFIATEVDRPTFRWQQKLPVPTAFLGAYPSTPNNVDHNLRQFVEVGLRELARQGCRSVGLIDPHLIASDIAKNPKDAPVDGLDMLEHFTDVAGELGLTIKNDWMRVAYQHHLRVQEQEYYGYEQFLKLWSLPEKPEGLVIPNDVIARGAITAIREKHARVPEELKLVLGKNESIDLFCPMPATFVVISERALARALIEQVQKQFRGETCERISLPFKIAAHINP